MAHNTYNLDYSIADQVYDDIDERGQLEDRREYDKDMLKKMYDLDDYSTEELYDLIQHDFGKDHPILAGFKGLLQASGIDPNSCCAPEDEGAAKLGRFVWDYLLAAIYDMNWEGFNDVQLHGIKTLLTDMALGAQSDPRAGDK